MYWYYFQLIVVIYYVIELLETNNNYYNWLRDFTLTGCLFSRLKYKSIVIQSVSGRVGGAHKKLLDFGDDQPFIHQWYVYLMNLVALLSLSTIDKNILSKVRVRVRVILNRFVLLYSTFALYVHILNEDGEKIRFWRWCYWRWQYVIYLSEYTLECYV
jgi:hypothetical protein